jgi:hypothetical protein
MTYDEQVKALEIKHGWTLEEAGDCGCNTRPNGPCERCWSLGWAIGGIEVRAKLKDFPENP